MDNSLSLYRIGPAKAASKARQLARWLSNPRIQPRAIYRPLIRAAPVDWEGETLYLALDSSQFSNPVLIRNRFMPRSDKR